MDKCLAFCQALTQSDHKFTLNLSIGKDKLFFSNKELTSSCKMKKKSPSQLRREERRKRERQSKVAEEVTDASKEKVTEKVAETDATAEEADVSTAPACDQCEYKATSERGLSQHTRMKHRGLKQPSASVLSTPESLRGEIKPDCFRSSPPPHIAREETCSNCGDLFTSDHQCDQGSTLDEEVVDICECGCGVDFEPCPAPHHQYSGCAQSCKTCLNVQYQLQMVNMLKDLVT